MSRRRARACNAASGAWASDRYDKSSRVAAVPRAVDKHFDERDKVPIDGGLQNPLQHGILAIGEQNQRLHQFLAAVLVKLRSGPLQAADQVLPLELRVAANAVVSRGCQFLSQ